MKILIFCIIISLFNFAMEDWKPLLKVVEAWRRADKQNISDDLDIYFGIVAVRSICSKILSEDIMVPGLTRSKQRIIIFLIYSILTTTPIRVQKDTEGAYSVRVFQKDRINALRVAVSLATTGIRPADLVNPLMALSAIKSLVCMECSREHYKDHQMAILIMLKVPSIINDSVMIEKLKYGLRATICIAVSTYLDTEYDDPEETIKYLRGEVGYYLKLSMSQSEQKEK